MSRKDDFEYLDEERKKLWAEVVAHRVNFKEVSQKIQNLNDLVSELSVQVERKTPDYEKEARSSSTQTTRYKNRAEEAARKTEAASATVESIALKASDIELQLASLAAKKGEIEQTLQFAIQAHSKFVSSEAELEGIAAKLSATIEEAEENLATTETISEKITEIKNYAESLNAKITALHSQSAKRNQDFLLLHEEIFGYSYKDEETGKESVALGKKAELEDIYSSLKKGLSEVDKELSNLRETKNEEYQKFSEEKSQDFDELKNRIRSLLPEAMTAGLSHAYEKKRVSEESEGKAAEKTYARSIFLLLAISFIPVLVSLYSFFNDGKTLDQVIHNLPQMVAAILPLYAPAFWFAISASKRIKLAKRLTEEYAHKEALSKTFEGLSSQISDLPESEVSRDLRVKLLYNIISVSSDNPGKLISDYNNSDNPLLEVLDKSLSLTKSLEKIAAVPGVHRILKKVEEKRAEKVTKIKQSVEENIPNGKDRSPSSSKGETVAT